MTSNFSKFYTPQHVLLGSFEKMKRPVTLAHDDHFLKNFLKNLWCCNNLVTKVCYNILEIKKN